MWVFVCLFAGEKGGKEKRGGSSAKRGKEKNQKRCIYVPFFTHTHTYTLAFPHTHTRTHTYVRTVPGRKSSFVIHSEVGKNRKEEKPQSSLRAVCVCVC